MAKPLKQEASSDEALSSGSSSSDEEQINEQINEEEDEEELEAVARSADSDDDEAADGTGDDVNADADDVDEVIILDYGLLLVHFVSVIIVLRKIFLVLSVKKAVWYRFRILAWHLLDYR